MSLRLRPGLARPSPPVGERSTSGRRCGLCQPSQGLIDHLSPCNDNIALLPNGVNHPDVYPPPPSFRRSCRGASSPILGYTGTLWRIRTSPPFCTPAQAMPACTFVFLGRREKNPWPSC